MALDFAAGCVGGCAGLMVGYPLDTIKVHIQTQDHRNPKFKGTWHCFRTILARDSITGLYRGVSSPMAGVAVVNAIVFGVYGKTQRNLADEDHMMTHFLAGASAGLAQSPICSPLELAKTRLQLQQSKVNTPFTGPVSCLRYVYRKEGHRGVFSGLGITALREAPSYGIYFLTYEALTRTSKVKDISTFHMLMAGGVAGTASWVATYPIDVIKSRLQADGHGRYVGALDCLRQSMKSEGYSWLFRGLNSTILRAFPTNAATFTVVTWTFRIFGGDSLANLETAEKPPNLEATNAMTGSQIGETPESLVNKCNNLVTRVMDDYNYEARSYCSANRVTQVDHRAKRIDKSNGVLVPRNNGLGHEESEKNDDVSNIQESDYTTSKTKHIDEGG